MNHRSSSVAPLFISSIVVATLLAATGVRLEATSFADFDKMNTFDQAEYVAVMVDAAETSLRKAGRADDARRLDAAFANTSLRTNAAASEGIAQMEAALDKARASSATVQPAMLLVLAALHIDAPPSVSDDVKASGEGFHPITYAEFHAKSADEQRRIIKALSLVGTFEYFARDIKTKGLAGSVWATYTRNKLEADIIDFMRVQFPTAGAQPGFARAVQRMEPSPADSGGRAHSEAADRGPRAVRHRPRLGSRRRTRPGARSNRRDDSRRTSRVSRQQRGLPGRPSILRPSSSKTTCSRSRVCSSDAWSASVSSTAPALTRAVMNPRLPISFAFSHTYSINSVSGRSATR